MLFAFAAQLNAIQRLLDAPVDLSDLAAIDAGRYQSFCWMMNNPIKDVIYETFSVTCDKFGESVVEDLVEGARMRLLSAPASLTSLAVGGRNIEVTDDNKMEYITRYIEWRTTTQSREQLCAFIEGFYDVIPREALSIFDHKELEVRARFPAEGAADCPPAPNRRTVRNQR